MRGWLHLLALWGWGSGSLPRDFALAGGENAASGQPRSGIGPPLPCLLDCFLYLLRFQKCCCGHAPGTHVPASRRLAPVAPV